MKKTIVLMMLLLLFCPGYTQPAGGLYMTAADFAAGKLACPGSTAAGQRVSVNAHRYIGNVHYVTINENGKKYRYKKDSVYGYRDSRGEAYRFYNNREYQIAEAGNIYVYTAARHIPGSKVFSTAETCYFSVGSDGPVMPLTYGNLVDACSNNEKFVAGLELYFGRYGNVAEYDRLHKMYKVNYVYARAMQPLDR